MPSQEQRLFLSMVSDEFRSYRELLTKDLERGQVDVATQEKWGTLGLTTLEKLDHHLARCSAVIHVVGDGVGHVPPAAAVDALLERHPDFLPRLSGSVGMTRELLGECSYTQFEAYLAIYHQARLHIYRPKAEAPREAGFTANETQRDNQRRHFERIRALGRDRDVFLNQERLSSYVLADLRDILPATISRIDVPPTKLRHTAERLIGREAELAMLDEAWNDPHKNVVVVRGIGGEGKTSLVAGWMAELGMKNWRGAECVYDWSFYSQGTKDQSSATADVFINVALAYFGDPDPNQGGPYDRGARLARLIAAKRCLLVLDGLEPLQYPPGAMHGQLKDPGMAALLKGLVARNDGLCVVTTREKVDEIKQHYGKSAVDYPLHFLSKEAGAALLHFSGARRAGEKGIEVNDPELQKASEEIRGHALTLSLVGQYLKLAESGDIRRRDTIKLAEADAEYSNDGTRPYGHAFKAIEAYERWFTDGDAEARRQLAVLRMLSLFDRPASTDCLVALRSKSIRGLTDGWFGFREKRWNIVLGRLQQINLVGINSDGGVNCHPLIREYFAERLKTTQPEALQAAHSLLFDFLCKSTEYRPKDLVGLQPLYQAVTHGCMAGRHQEACHNVYVKRILQGPGSEGSYSTFKLGAVGADLAALVMFFETPWSRLSSNLIGPVQAWLFNEAAFRLRCLGRLKEAVEPLMISVEMYENAKDLEQAVFSANNLSEIQSALGRLEDGVNHGYHAISLSDQGGSLHSKVAAYTTAAYALYQRGQRGEGRKLFVEAERIQAEGQPTFPILYSSAGFEFADMIMVPAERMAWSRIIKSQERDSGKMNPGQVMTEANLDQPWSSSCLSDAIAACVEGERRGIQTLEWSNSRELLPEIARDRLTVARAVLYRFLIANDGIIFDIPSRIDSALAAFRNANWSDDLPKALLTAALYAGTLGGSPEEADQYLAEAQGIAERGPMPLHLADVHLHRARLFRDRGELGKARELIERCGYWRRKEELEDAEGVAGGW